MIPVANPKSLLLKKQYDKILESDSKLEGLYYYCLLDHKELLSKYRLTGNIYVSDGSDVIYVGRKVDFFLMDKFDTFRNMNDNGTCFELRAKTETGLLQISLFIDMCQRLNLQIRYNNPKFNIYNFEIKHKPNIEIKHVKYVSEYSLGRKFYDLYLNENVPLEHQFIIVSNDDYTYVIHKSILEVAGIPYFDKFLSFPSTDKTFRPSVSSWTVEAFIRYLHFDQGRDSSRLANVDITEELLKFADYIDCQDLFNVCISKLITDKYNHELCLSFKLSQNNNSYYQMLLS